MSKDPSFFFLLCNLSCKCHQTIADGKDLWGSILWDNLDLAQESLHRHKQMWLESFNVVRDDDWINIWKGKIIIKANSYFRITN